MENGKRILITGAAGNVARRIVPLLREKYTLILADLVEIPHVAERTIKLDLTNQAEALDGLAGVDAIVHCAIAGYGSGECRSEAERQDYHNRMLEVNVKGTYHVFEAARILRVPRLVYISSLTVALGDDPAGMLATDRPPRPVDVYACTKIFGENLGRVYHEAYGMEVINLRLGQPYPLGLPREKNWETNPRSASLFVTLGDIARAVDAALSARTVKFGIYNVVSLNDEPWIEVASAQEIGFQPQEKWQDFQPAR